MVVAAVVVVVIVVAVVVAAVVAVVETTGFVVVVAAAEVVTEGSVDVVVDAVVASGSCSDGADVATEVSGAAVVCSAAEVCVVEATGSSSCSVGTVAVVCASDAEVDCSAVGEDAPVTVDALLSEAQPAADTSIIAAHINESKRFFIKTPPLKLFTIIAYCSIIFKSFT